ncbi:MAG: 1-deoxy-D-xylulose-5-phosphate synthase [Archangium sp.]|nr:1-deoxy-D-xylulose-5-phosphate synthase [Archangium sp.]
MSLLTRVDSPKALRALEAAQLPALCAELREEIISICGHVGGHLGASLGAVELIVALHRAFKSPVDRLVFDVGHQAYAHKILTGRRVAMSTLRQEGGIAPFLDPAESEHDAFGAGHACTALSVALGILEGKRRQQQPGDVVAIVGDGALTGGLTFEALNHAGTSNWPIKLVLNDNGMSISKNVGAVEQLLRQGPRPFFEAMGFVYVGPVDGHDLDALADALAAAKRCQKPMVVHARTQKGRGYGPAELDARTRGHAMGPYAVSGGPSTPLGVSGGSSSPSGGSSIPSGGSSIPSGGSSTPSGSSSISSGMSGANSTPHELRDGKLVRSRGGQRTWSDAFAAALEMKMERDPRVVVITPAMLEGSSLTRLAERFPDRVHDVGIAEQHAVTFAAGLAHAGLRPVVCIYSTFLQRAYDQLVHDVVLPRLPVVFAVDRAGLVGADGATHQGMFDLSFLRGLPGLRVQGPVWGDDLPLLLDQALGSGGPVAIRFPRGTLPAGPAPSAPGVRWLADPPGAALSLVAFGSMVLPALEAARGENWSVVDVSGLPLSEGLVTRLRAARAIVTVEEGTTRGGLGSAVLEAISDQASPPRVRVLGLPADRFVRHGEARAQRAVLGLDAAGIRQSALEVLTGPR